MSGIRASAFNLYSNDREDQLRQEDISQAIMDTLGDMQYAYSILRGDVERLAHRVTPDVSGFLTSDDISDFVTQDDTDSLYQSEDVTLTALAGVATSADEVIYATGSDAFATTSLTTFGRSLIDDASASDARTTLGLGLLAVKDSINNDDWSGTDLAVANGGTGASVASSARANLGLAFDDDVHFADGEFDNITSIRCEVDVLDDSSAPLLGGHFRFDDSANEFPFLAYNAVDDFVVVGREDNVISGLFIDFNATGYSAASSAGDSVTDDGFLFRDDTTLAFSIMSGGTEITRLDEDSLIIGNDENTIFDWGSNVLALTRKASGGGKLSFDTTDLSITLAEYDSGSQSFDDRLLIRYDTSANTVEFDQSEGSGQIHFRTRDKIEFFSGINGTNEEMQITDAGVIIWGPASLCADGTSETLKFFNDGGSTQQDITGSTGGNAALQNLLAALDNYGLITDSTT